MWFSKKSGVLVDITYEKWISGFDKKYTVKAGAPILTTLAGVGYNDCQDVIIRNIRDGKIDEGTKFILLPDPSNKYDKTATRVCTVDGWMVGWLPNKDWNDRIFSDLMTGKKWEATLKDAVDISTEFKNYNLLIELWEFFDNTIY